MEKVFQAKVLYHPSIEVKFKKNQFRRVIRKGFFEFSTLICLCLNFLTILISEENIEFYKILDNSSSKKRLLKVYQRNKEARALFRETNDDDC